MKYIKQTEPIDWIDFFNNIKLFRHFKGEDVVYTGRFKNGPKMYESTFSLKRITFDESSDDVQYIDDFAKEQIAKDLEEQINRR